MNAGKPMGNLLLRYGLIAAPTAVFCHSLRHGLMLSFAFCCVTVISVLISRIVPHRLPHSVRIVLYSVIAGLVYIPTAWLTVAVFHESGYGIYLPLLSAGLYLTLLYDRFFRREKLLRTLVHQIGGTVLVLLVISAVRELFGAGTLLGMTFFANPPLPALLTPPFGMMMLVLCAAGYSSAERFARKGESHAVPD